MAERVAETEQPTALTKQGNSGGYSESFLNHQFKPGQSGNPGGLKSGKRAFYDVLCAYAGEKPEGDEHTRFESLIAAIWKRAIGGSSRHAQLLVDRLMPHKSIRITEDTRTVQVLMQIAAPPSTWQQPVIELDADGEGKLIDSKASDDVESG